MRPFARADIVLRSVRSRLTSISVNVTFFFRSSALASRH
jgi:hypothetical protein